jgi:hypothetical protein
MNTKTVRSVGLAALLLLSVFAVAQPVAAAGDTTVSIPSDQTVGVGSSTTFDVVVDDASDGVGSYDISVRLTNGSVGTITDVSLAGSPGISDVNVSADGTTATANAAAGVTSNTGAVTVFTVTVEGQTAGTTGVAVDANSVGDENGVTYSITDENDGQLTVQSNSANYEITSVSAPAAVAQGDDVTAQATVENTGNAAGNQTVEFGFAGSAADSEVVALGAGESRTVSLTAATGSLSNGTYSYTVSTDDDSASGDVSVLANALSVELDPAQQETGTGGTATYSVVVDDATEGVGSYTIDLAVGNDTVGNITGVDLAGSPALTDVELNGSTASATASSAGLSQTGAVTILDVTVEGQAVGTTTVTATADSVGSEDGSQSYNIGAAGSATLTVTAAPTLPGASGPVSDTDGDGVYEDLNGDGQFTPADVTYLFSNRNIPAIQNNAALFDYNGDGGFSPADITVLFNEL